MFPLARSPKGTDTCSYDSNGPWTAIAITSHDFFVTIHAPIGFAGNPQNLTDFPPRAVTAKRLDYVTKTYKGNNTNYFVAVRDRVNSKMKFGGFDLIDFTHRNIWKLIDEEEPPAPPHVPRGYQCTTLTMASVVQMQILGRDVKLGFAHATFDDRVTGPPGYQREPDQKVWDATVLKKNGYTSLSTLQWFTDAGDISSGQFYEAFIWDVPTNAGFTVFPPAGPFYAYSGELQEVLVEHEHSLLQSIAFNVMRYMLSPNTWPVPLPKDQRWTILYTTGRQFLGDPVSFPVSLP